MGLLPPRYQYAPSGNFSKKSFDSGKFYHPPGDGTQVRKNLKRILGRGISRSGQAHKIPLRKRYSLAAA